MGRRERPKTRAWRHARLPAVGEREGEPPRVTFPGRPARPGQRSRCLLYSFSTLHRRDTLGGVEWPRLPSLWSTLREGWTQDSRPPSGAWLLGMQLCTPRRGGSLSPAAGPGDFSSIGGTVSTHGPGRVFLPVTGEINSPQRYGSGQAANSTFAFHSLVSNQRCCQNTLVRFGKVN